MPAAQAGAPQIGVTTETWIALLGRRDWPTDGIEDYCTFLGSALARQGIALKIVRVGWKEIGWRRALRALSREAADWRGKWVLLQYTALGWSRRGFPAGVLAAQRILRRRGARCAVVFHEPTRQSDDARLVGRLRGAFQDRVVRRLFRGAAIGLFADSLETIPWLPRGASKASFHPIGPNIPECTSRPSVPAACNGAPKTVAVFCLTRDSSVSRELDDISFALRFVAARNVKLRLVFLGGGTTEAKDEIERRFRDFPAEVVNLGLRSAEEVSDVLGRADTMLCVRGMLFPRRGSAIAGIACGLPIVGYSSGRRAFPLDEAGVQLVPYGDRNALAEALARVLLDSGLNDQLRAKSVQAHKRFFSWDVIAGEMVRALHQGAGSPANAPMKHAVRSAEGVEPAPRRPYRTLVVNSHPVQYASPVYRLLAKDPRLQVQVAYCSMQGAEPYADPDFGVQVKWDTPLLEGFAWISMPNRSPFPRSRSFFRFVNPQLWSLIRSRKFDAVILYTGYLCASFWIAILAAKSSGIPVLFGTDAHDLAPQGGGKKWKIAVKKLLWPLLFRLADVVIVPSSAAVALMRSLGIREGRIVLTPYIVDNDWWIERSARVNREEVRARWEIPRDAVVMVFSAKLQPWKRPQDLLHAFARMHLPNAYLVFAGDGSMRPGLEAEAQSLGIAEKVRFLGFLNQSALPEVYTASDILVLPSEFEPFGVVVNEAMLCGCCVVVSDRVGARPDLVQDGETGFVYPVGDTHALAALLARISSDRANLKRIGYAARERMSSWSPRTNVERTIRAIRIGILRSSSPPGESRDRK